MPGQTKPPMWCPGMHRQDRQAGKLDFYMPMWESDGLRVMDLVNGNTGTRNGVVWGVTEFGPYLQFDGVSDFLALQRSVTVPGTDGTIAFWAQFDDLGRSSDGVLSNSGSHSINYIRRNPTGGGQWQVETNTNGDTNNYTSPIPDNGWHHIAFRFLTSASELYIDGKLSDTRPAFVDDFVFDSIGADHAVVSMDGGLADMMLWSRTLSSSEIQQLFADSNRMLRMRRSVPLSSGVAPAGVAPTSVLYGSLVGPLGGAV